LNPKPGTPLLQDAPAPKVKKGTKAAPPKLDDAASWPSIGGAVAPAGGTAPEEEAEAEADEDEEAVEAEVVEVEEEAATEAVDPAADAPAVANGSLVSVKLDVSDDGSVAVTLGA
jgi:hypothetical protein